MKRILFLSCLLAFLPIGWAHAAIAELGPCVWIDGEHGKRDRSAVFRASFDFGGEAKPTLAIAASALYRVTLNGEFVGWGPARTVYGSARVDEWPLSPRPGRNVLAVEVAGYSFESYQYSGGDPFFTASVTAGGRQLAATPGDFEAVESPRVMAGPVYSRQRGFPAEAYEIDRDYLSYLAGGESHRARLKLKVVKSPKYLEREVPYPDFTVNANFATARAALGEAMFALPAVDSGFVGLELKCLKPGKVIVEFDEALGTNGVIDLKRNGDPLKSWHAMYNRLGWQLQEPGDYRLETIEPYTLKYARLRFEGGEFAEVKLYLRRCRNALVGRSSFASGDGELNALFAAAGESLAQNAVDLLTDCPSRERVGWLCDTFFSSEAAAYLTGDFSIEREYLLNFTRTDDFGKGVPRGAIPGFMPSRRGQVMPTYMMWFVIQSCAAAERLEGVERSNFTLAVKSRIEGIFRWIAQYEKEGLLEDLPGWVFIEWSKANDYVKGVNYPANMMWAYALDRSGRLYNRPEWIAKAETIRQRILRQSFDGTRFHDQALRDAKGALVRQAATQTETCQYYAFFTGLANPKTFPSLWRMTVDELGPNRCGHEDMDKSDAFIGWLLRLELLSRFGERQRLLSDIKSYYGAMAKASGTFWEFADGHDSRCHAIGSYVAVLLLRAATGIRRVDWARRTVELTDEGLPGVKCAFPVPGGKILKTEKGLVLPPGWKSVKSISVE